MSDQQKGLSMGQSLNKQLDIFGNISTGLPQKNCYGTGGCGKPLDMTSDNFRVVKNGKLNSICRKCESKRDSGRRSAAVKNGICGGCKKAPLVSGYRMCLECFLKEKARSAGIGTSGWIDLYEKFQSQRGRCALTGRDIDIMSAEVDHIVPKCKNEIDKEDREKIWDTIENIQFVTPQANRGKWMGTNEEFGEMCVDGTVVYLQEIQKKRVDHE